MRASTPKRSTTTTNSATPKKGRTIRRRTIGDDEVEKLLQELECQPLVGRVHKFKLSDALRHIATVDNRRLRRLVAEFGAPPFYLEKVEPQMDTFRALSRIIIGQQLAGSAVRAIWAKFVAVFGDDVTAITPSAVLAQDLETMRASAGLSNAKARALCDLAAHYERGDLTDNMILDPALSATDLAVKLLAVKGVGPWSCNMYQMFSLQLPNVFPTGDLGVRNGIAKVFELRGTGKNSALDEKKDMDKLQAAFAPYEPYRSVASWYMWRALETPSFMDE